MLVAFLQYSVRFFRPISDMSEKFNVLQSAMASSERIFKLLDEPVAIESPAAPIRRPAAAAGHIAFEHVWFSYAAAGTTKNGWRGSAGTNAATPRTASADPGGASEDPTMC